jgi:hypothetical protein
VLLCMCIVHTAAAVAAGPSLWHSAARSGVTPGRETVDGGMKRLSVCFVLVDHKHVQFCADS